MLRSAEGDWEIAQSVNRDYFHLKPSWFQINLFAKDDKAMTAEGNEGNAILIVGPNTLQNELIASFLEKETSVKCFAIDNYAELESLHASGEDQHLLLYDCMGKAIDGCMEQCAPLLEKNPGMHRLCLFNLKKGAGLEPGLVTQGVRGFFYSEEPFQQLAKGVRAVLNGEFWVSRKIMTDLIIKNNLPARVHEDILSRRETDILAMIVEGATNEEIADKLCISKHTVKTHLYNIFKKLDVRSRFQAALWAAKHL
jgi:DNA-binding NarL/FixJ family response regulator